MSSRGIIKDVVVIVICLVAGWFILQAVFGTPNPFYVVSSGSMIPELEAYDILVVSGNDPFGEVQIGDIIVFNRPNGHDRVIVHRVVAVTDEDPRTLRTKGDANPSSIPGTDFPITREEYIGSVVYVIPQAGYITRVLSPPVNYIIIAVIVGIMVTKHLYGKRRDDEGEDGEEESGGGMPGGGGAAQDGGGQRQEDAESGREELCEPGRGAAQDGGGQRQEEEEEEHAMRLKERESKDEGSGPAGDRPVGRPEPGGG